MSELHSIRLVLDGFRAGLEVADGQVHLYNKSAKSDLRFPVEDVVGVTGKKPGMSRGYIAIQTLDAPIPPAGTVAAMNHPQAVPLAMSKGEWAKAESLISAINRWLADNPAAARGIADPYADVDVSDGRIQKHVGGLREHLDMGERVEAIISGAYDTKLMGNDTVRTGILAATNRRLIFYSRRMVGYDMESFPYENISSFEQANSMMGSKVNFFASGNRVEVKWIQAGQLDELQRIVRSRMGKRPTEPASASAGEQSPAPEQSAADKIRELARLRDDGILSDDEFTQAKAKLLGL